MVMLRPSTWPSLLMPRRKAARKGSLADRSPITPTRGARGGCWARAAAGASVPRARSDARAARRLTGVAGAVMTSGGLEPLGGGDRTCAHDGARQLDLAEVGHAVGEAHHAEGAQGRHLAERAYRYIPIQEGRVVLGDERLGGGPHLAHILLEGAEVLDAEGLRLRRRHARTLCHLG